VEASQAFCPVGTPGLPLCIPGRSTAPRGTEIAGSWIETDVPIRLDRLPWASWHSRVVLALGITWVLDGLEVTLAGTVASVLTEPDTLALTDSQVGLSATAYVAGAILGALFFGWLTDRLGRKRLFLVTLLVYLTATLLTGCSIGLGTYLTFRFFTGAGIGGEYAAINSAIDELLPARVRGRADLGINASYWLGAALGAGATLLLLDPRVVPHAIGWRLMFGLGAVLGGAILLVRRYVPESPRWLLLHGHVAAADAIVAEVERAVAREHGDLAPVGRTIPVQVKARLRLADVVHVLVRRHPRRSVLCFALMVSQAFCYNAIFFTYALILARFYDVPAGRVGLYLLPFAVANFVGPLLLGPLFDTWSRRHMIVVTYVVSALLLLVTAYGFVQGWLTAATQTALWSAVFFFASAAASSAYLSASELFPVELRGLAIAIFYAVGTGTGGLVAPALFGRLIETGSRAAVVRGYALGAVLMLLAAAVAFLWGVSAERRSLEELAAAQ
jgi:MFS family permease